MPLIHDSEMEDFQAAIVQAGFKVDDFHVVQLEDQPAATEQHRNTGTVTVTQMSTGHSTTYRAGYGSAWSAVFEDDLKAGVFCQP